MSSAAYRFLGSLGFVTGLLFPLLACSGGSVEPDSRYQGVSTGGDRVQFDFFREESEVEGSTGQEEPVSSGIEEDSNLELDEVWVSGDGRYGVELEDEVLVTNFAAGGEATLSVAFSSAEALGYGFGTTGKLVEGDYLWLSFQECGAGDFDWGYLTLGDESYASRRMGPPATFQDAETFEGTVTEDLADETGSWEFASEEDPAELLIRGEENYSAWVLPGRALLIRRDSGFVLAVSNPSAHLGLFNASGVYKFMDMRCDGDELESWGVGNFSTFDREVSYVRYSSDGSEERLEGDLDWHANVGSGFGILLLPEEGVDKRIYLSVVEDYAMIFQYGEQPSAGLAVRVGIAGL